MAETTGGFRGIAGRRDLSQGSALGGGSYKDFTRTTSGGTGVVSERQKQRRVCPGGEDLSPWLSFLHRQGAGESPQRCLVPGG